jgi:hypothetical protein
MSVLNLVGRAELQRTVVLVVALLVTAGATNASAREFRAADIRNEVFHSRQPGGENEILEQTRTGAIDLNRQNVHRRHDVAKQRRIGGAHTVELPYGQMLTGLATRLTDGAGNDWPSIVTDIDNKPFEPAMTGVCATAQRDPASAPLIEPIRKVE